MSARTASLLGVLLLPAIAPAQDAPPTPPVARVIPHRLELHGDVRVDNYYWLRERDDPDVIAHLEAENAYTAAMLSHTEALREALYDEIVARIKEDDATAPVFDDGYYYASKYEAGRQYPVLVRKRGSLDAEEEVLLDENELAEGHAYFSLGRTEVSPDGTLIAFATDTTGRRIATVRFKDLESGAFLDDELAQVTGNVAWANDNETIFYSKQDPQTLRSYRIYRHVLGTDPADDVLVFEEGDEEFSCFVSRTKSDEYLLITSSQTLSTESRFLDADDPTGTFAVVQPRERNLEYSVDHLGDAFYLRTNLDAPNFRLMTAPVSSPGKEHWSEVVPGRDDVFLEGFELFAGHLVTEERRDGLVRLVVRPRGDEAEPFEVDFGEPAYTARIGPNHEIDTTTLRYIYTSLTTPVSSIDYDLDARESTVVKRDEVLGDFDPGDYTTERLLAVAGDGTEVPISIVSKEGFPKDGSRPLLLYGYGSYGNSLDASFDSARLSLLDRGFAFAIAHVRGGQELGRSWYEDGKLLNKMNTFTDFIACAEHLIAEGYAVPDRLFAQGGSAGGLLMGAVINLRPGLFRGVIAAVPFVDVVTTMLDPSIPLTTFEYDEWGNPDDPIYYEYMRSYSPYDNVEAKGYPNLLVTTSLADSQVQYWEPAKWVAKLRATRTDDNLLLFRTYLEGSHGGVSGRYRRYRETAFEYAFLLDLAGLGR
ncbi:S9 family peptidase [Tautonia plasticadhaerens]|uniref:Protease 2 n=1 Tax=Tautonia plasticadhaerens TaxID=2527974 RepID=A0A518GUP0_9BACT|nr:S9 family peptidase [Tautonia plasticadhaerens]QDV32305.1 Protease 2 [Tautonia plasticadhaerens]